MFRALTHHWRVHIAVVAGAAVASAVLTGALLVGDSVRGSLRELTEQRLGGIESGLVAARFVRQELFDELTAQPAFAASGALAAPAIVLRGAAVHGDTGTRASKVSIHGVDGRFAALHGAQPDLDLSRREGQIFPSAAISHTLAQELAAAVGDALVLSFGRFSPVPRDTLMGETDVEEVLGTIRVTVVEVLPDTGLGQFGLVPAQQDPLGAFVEIGQLQRALDLPGKINGIFLGPTGEGVGSPDRMLAEVVQLADLGLSVIGADAEFHLESEEFVLRPNVDAAVAKVAEKLGAPVLRVQSYLANAIRFEDRLLPYSLLVALDAPSAPGGASLRAVGGQAVPLPGEGEIAVNTWVAEDLGVSVGDVVALDYFSVGPREELINRSVELRVSAVVDIAGLGADRSLTPEYPGIQEAEDLASWDPPFPVDLDLVRDKDEQYWDDHGATPKGFVGAVTGNALWATRFGTTTSARIGVAPGSSLDATIEAFRRGMLEEIPPASFGLSFRPLKADGLGAAKGATDFAGLFVSFSFFLILSAALLIGLLFGLGVERRAREVGLMLAVGYPVRTVRNGFLKEGAVLAATGAAIGLAGGVAYAWLMMAGLRSLWVGAVGSSRLYLHIQPLTLPLGWVISMIVILVAIALTVRRLRKVPPPMLLAGSITAPGGPRRRRITPILAWGGLLLGVVIAGWAIASGRIDDPGAAFGSSAMMLVSGLAFFALWCRGSRSKGMGLRANTAIAGMAARNSAWNPGRSILSVALVATACFAIVMVAASKREFGDELRAVDSGSGGFPLIAEAQIPLHQDLGSAEDRLELGFDDDAMAALGRSKVIPLRSLPGDDASCLNLYQPESPRVLGAPDDLINRGGFAFQKTMPLPEGETNPWTLLNQDLEPGVVPAFADANSAMWILHLGLGKDLVMEDEFGEGVTFRLVGLFQTSIFQSELIVAEDRFLEHFPSRTGYGVFLIDTPWEGAGEVAQALESTLGTFGFDATGTPARLEAYKQVEHTYMATFQVLGGFGLLLGTIGLGIVLVRNVIERRGELATLRAFGFRRASLGWLVLAENAFLLFVGLGIGTGAALVGVAPRLAQIHTSWTGLALTLVVIAAVGMLASVAAVYGALRVPLLPALKAER